MGMVDRYHRSIITTILEALYRLVLDRSLDIQLLLKGVMVQTLTLALLLLKSGSLFTDPHNDLVTTQ